MRVLPTLSFMFFAASGVAFAMDPIEARTAPGQFASDAEAAAHVEQVLHGAAADIRSVNAGAGVIRLDGGVEAARALRSDPAFLSVRSDTITRETRDFAVLLDDTGMQIEHLAQGRADSLSPTLIGWPGEFLQVIARDLEGNMIADGYVRDHRFFRYEGWNPDGSHVAGSNVSQVDETEPVDVWLTLPAATASVEIRSTLETDLTGETEFLGRAEVSIPEKGQ